MKPIYFCAVLIFAFIFAGCDDEREVTRYVDPRYAEMYDVAEISSTKATFVLRMKVPVSRTTDGFLVEEKYFDDYMFFYTTDPNSEIRVWQRAEGSVRDESGTYSLAVSDLLPGTRYYVKAAVMVAPRAMQAVNYSFSASVLEFATTQ